MAQPERDVTLTVFMEGTSNPMSEITTQIALFSRLCKATELPEELPAGSALENSSPGHYKVSFNGCGVSHGLRGLIFAHGLKEQCAVVRAYVEAFLRQDYTVRLNFVGLSRGGIGGLYLAQELQDLDVSQVLINLLLFDPVPGNFVWVSRYVDLARQTNANQAMDVSEVANLGRVLVLYPYEPLPALAVHAPLVVRLPEGCDVEVDVILGCHQGALFLRPRTETILAFSRIRDFLLECGSVIERSQATKYGLDVPDEDLVQQLDRELRRNQPNSRFAHGPVAGTHIMRYPSGRYLNKSHRRLLEKLGRISEGNAGISDSERLYMLDLEVPSEDD